jgi:predicted phosphodiesterase
MHVTRRRFLQSVSVIPALTIASQACAGEAADELPLFTFVVDADPHTSIDRDGELTGRDKFRRLLDKVQSLPTRPDFMLILGDVHGEPLREILRDVDFDLPIHLVFGNSDDKPGRKILRDLYPGDFAEADYYAFTHKQCKFIGLCNAIPGDHVGHLSSEFYRGMDQCSWLEAQLAEGQDRCTHSFVFGHVPLPPQVKEANYYLAVNDQRFLRQLALKYEPTALLFGHLHRLETFSVGKTRVVSVHGSNWTNTLVPPPYDPIGFNLVHVFKNRFTVEFIPMAIR